MQEGSDWQVQGCELCDNCFHSGYVDIPKAVYKAGLQSWSKILTSLIWNNWLWQFYYLINIYIKIVLFFQTWISNNSYVINAMHLYSIISPILNLKKLFELSIENNWRHWSDIFLPTPIFFKIDSTQKVWTPTSTPSWYKGLASVNDNVKLDLMWFCKACLVRWFISKNRSGPQTKEHSPKGLSQIASNSKMLNSEQDSDKSRINFTISNK